MQQLHDKLMEKDGSYAKWHKHPRHQAAQWLILLLVVFGVGWLLVNRTQSPDGQTYGLFGSAKGLNVSQGKKVGYAQDHILVKFLSSVSEASAKAKLEKRGSAEIEELPDIKVKKVKDNDKIDRL